MDRAVDSWRIDKTEDLTAVVVSLWGAHLDDTLAQDQTLRDPRHGSSMPQLLLPKRELAITAEAARLESTYILRNQLGSGGQGTVHRALQSTLARSVAIKRIKDDLLGDAQTKASFINEALLQGQLEHPGIPPIHELAYDQDGHPFLAMKQIHGRAWSKIIEEKNLTDNLGIFHALCDAVAYAHARGVVHRDLKPSNVMIGEFGEIQLMDWGLAIRVGNAQERSDGAIGGTPAYMAPEMALGEMSRIDQRSDVYLLGAILFEMITGKRPHRGANTMACLCAAAENRIEATAMQSSLLTVAYRAMSTDMDARYANVAALRSAILQFRGHEESDRLCEEGLAALERGECALSYDGFVEAQALLQQALRVLPHNEAASEGLKRCRVAYARAALQRGDLDLAWQNLDRANPEHAHLVEHVHRAFRSRTAIRRRLHWLIVLLIAGNLISLVGIALLLWF